jgi:hypothetical protein
MHSTTAVRWDRIFASVMRNVLFCLQGLLAGAVRSAADLLASNLQALQHSTTVRWAYFSPSYQVPVVFLFD